MKKHIKLVFAVIVGLLVYLYVNKMFNASQPEEQLIPNSIQELLSIHHDQIQMETKRALEEYYSGFGILDISLCASLNDCYEIIDTGNAIMKTHGTIQAEKGPKELSYVLFFSIKEGDFQVQDINISK